MNFRFPKSGKAFIFMICGTCGNIVDPSETIIPHFRCTKLCKWIQGNPIIILDNIICRNLKISSSKMLEKTRAEMSLRSVLSILEHLEYGIKIVRKKHEMEIMVFSIQFKNLSHPPFAGPNQHWCPIEFQLCVFIHYR